MNKKSLYKSVYILVVKSKYNTVMKEVLVSMVNKPLKWVPQPKPVVISTVPHKYLADISNLNGGSTSDKANLTPYREGNMYGIAFRCSNWQHDFWTKSV